MKLFEEIHYRVFAQVLFWGCLLGIPNLLLFGTGAPDWFYWRGLLLTVAAICLIAINIYLLVPHFFSRKQYLNYMAGVAVSVLIAIMVGSYFEILAFDTLPTILQPPQGFPVVSPKPFIQGMLFTAAIMVSTVFESVQLQREQEKRTSQAQQEKLEAEMKFLKSQINPHFLFNALNNVYALSYIKSDQTPEVVMKLSEMLRYMLYETHQDRVPIGREVSYIENYIALQMLKDDVPLAVKTDIQVNTPTAQIAPMLLIPFIENAFKHSKVEDTENGWIDLRLSQSGDEIHMKVSNSMTLPNVSKDTTGGVGLQNVKRRLALEYPNRHELNIRRNLQRFDVSLLIRLQ